MSASQIEFNERTIEEYKKENIDPPYDAIARKERNDRFKSKFKIEKGELQIIIKTMHRRSVITYDNSGKAIRKDHLTYDVDYGGHDWLSNELWIRGHLHGVYQKPKFNTTTSINPETGEHIIKKEVSGQEDIYYIELTDRTRKKIIEDIINKSNGTSIDQILFYYHVPDSGKGAGFRSNLYTYDQFINSSPEEMEMIARKTPSPVQYLIKDKKEYHG